VATLGTVLIASPAATLRRRLAKAVRSAGYAAVMTTDEVDTGRALCRRPILAALLSFGPQVDPPIVRSLRAITEVPILVLAGEPVSEPDVVSVLDAGADECFRAAVGPEELGARLRAALRRTERPESRAIETPDFHINLVDRRAVRGGEEVRLTPIEWRLVDLLVSRSGHLVSRESLLVRVWGAAPAARSHDLRVHMAAIRRKLEPDPGHPRYFITVPGLGVRFQGGELTSN